EGKVRARSLAVRPSVRPSCQLERSTASAATDRVTDRPTDPTHFCRGLVDEIEWAIKKVDPKKTIQVGSYRIGPDGSQKTNEILYARSETHLSEILEDVCSNLDDYSLYEDPETQKKTYMRFAPRESEKMSSVDFNNFKFDPENSKSLKFACETIVEEYEDEIISLFTHETDQVADMLCIEKSEFCEPSQASPHTDL
uniref:Canopy FGF signaling regulator 1 n=1 Tax=Callorhinchus milii TaxID=7868 RepID=A0A4W3I2E3_CALMI